MTDKSEGEVSPQQTTNNEDSQNENINILDEVKETLRDEPSEYNLDLLFDHFEDLSGPYKKKVILYMEKAAGIKVGLIGAKAKEHLEALTAKQKDKGEKTDLIAEIGGNYFSTPQGLAFYYGKDSIPIEVESTQFEGLLSEIKYNADGRPANGEEILAVRRLARYYASKNVREVGVRTARDGDAIIYDPLMEDGKVFRIDKTGLQLVSPESPLTVRFTGMLPAEVKEGSQKDYLNLSGIWSMDDSTRILSIGLDFSRFIPGIPHAIEDVIGDHGAGKTSYTETKRELIDPSGALSQSLKWDERDISISALHQGVLAFDNVNTTMPDYISDVLCRISTGQGFRTRELYSNTSEVILKLKKPIIINGINLPGYKPDFLDRSVPILLRPIFGDGRLTENEIRQRVQELLPKARGYLLSIIPRAIQLYPDVEKELMGKLPRMADFVIWAECGLRAMGFSPNAFFDAYQQVKKRETEDLAKENTLIIAIQELMEGKDEWKGTSSELLEALNPYVTENKRRFDAKVLPNDPKRLGRLIKEHELVLRDLGLEIVTLSDGNRTKMIKRIGLGDRVNVSDVRNESDLTKYGLPGADINQNTISEKEVNVSKIEPTENRVQSKTDKTDINNMYGTPNTNNDHLGYLIRVCTQNPGPLNPLKKLRKGMPFRIHKNEISSYNFYDFSKEPEKGEVSEKDEDIHFIETFKAAEIPDRLMRVKQELLLVLGERPAKSTGTLQRKLSDLEPDLSLADISAAVKELMAMRLVHKSEDGRYMPGKEAPHD